jgi:thiamine-monophosphate kinase
LSRSSPQKANEFQIIEAYFKDLTEQDGVVTGIGDDGAVIELSLSSNQLVVATDTLLEHVHFPSSATAERIGHRALCVNLSDMAAMGAKPRWFTLALTLPKEYAKESWLKKFSTGLADVASEYNCALIGGDTTAGPLTISITVIGEVVEGQSLKRQGAKAEDYIYVTGTLADGAAGLSAINDIYGCTSIDIIERERLVNRFYRPEPKIAEGLMLNSIASACIDVSDGLVADLGHICNASGLNAEIFTDKLPVHANVKRIFPDQFLSWALFAGDDYQLCFTVSQEYRALMSVWIEEGIIDATEIGVMAVSSKISGQVLIDGMPVEASKKGFDHFE